MRISMKVILWLWVGLLLIIGAVLYSAYSKLQPDKIVSVFNEEIQRSYPQAQLTIGNVDYGFALDFHINLKEVKLSEKDKLLGKIGEVEFKIPWWLLIFNRGSAQINLSDFEIYLENQKGEIVSPKTGNDSIPTVVDVSLPSYLSDASYTIRAKNVVVKDSKTNRRFFSLSKLLVREFQYGKNSAFELNIPVRINHQNKQFTSELWLFGDVTPDIRRWELKFRGDFKTQEVNENFHLDDLVIDGKANFDPQTLYLKSDMNLLIDRKNIGKGYISARSSEMTAELEFTELPVDYLGLIEEEAMTPFLASLEGKAAGILNYSKNFNKNKSTFEGKVVFPGNFTINKEIAIEGKWQLSLENNKREISFVSPKGDLSFFKRAFINLAEGKVSQYSQEIGFSGMEVRYPLQITKNLYDFLTDNSSAHHSTLISIKKCFDDEKLVDGKAHYGTLPDQKYYKLSLTDEKSKLALNFLKKESSNHFSLDMQKFNFKDYHLFLSPFFVASEGIFDGKIEGRWTEKWLEGKWLSKLKSSSLGERSGSFFVFNQKIWSIFNLDAAKYAEYIWNSSIENGKLKLHPFSIQSSDFPSITGTLASGQKSVLTMSYPPKKKMKAVTKEVTDVFWEKVTP